MNVINVGSGSDFELGRPPTLEEVAGRSGMLTFPRVEDINPDSDFAELLGPGVLDNVKTAACWRQVAFLSEQIGRLFGPQDADAKRNMTPELAELENQQLLIHLTSLGIVKAAQQESPGAVVSMAA